MNWSEIIANNAKKLKDEQQNIRISATVSFQAQKESSNPNTNNCWILFRGFVIKSSIFVIAHALFCNNIEGTVIEGDSGCKIGYAFIFSCFVVITVIVVRYYVIVVF